MRNGSQPTLIVILCATCLVLGWTPAEGSTGERPGIHRQLEWSAPATDRQGKALMLYSGGREKARTRLLVETPSGRHVVLTKDLNGVTGIDRVRLLDDRTGWWVEVRTRIPIEADSLRAFLHEAMNLVEKEDVDPLEVAVTTRGGFEADAELPANTQPWVVHQGFVAELERSGRSKEIRAEVPEGLAREVDFLEAVLVEEGFDLRAPVEILDGLLPEAPESRTTAEWRLRRSKLEKGVTPVSPDALEFTSRFRSVRNTEPLVDERR